jgi:multisubunit Na+/H+ antiporter MnhG subunit
VLARAFLVYTAGRLLVLVGVGMLLYGLGLRGLLLAAVAVLLSLPLSYLLLARQRLALGAEVERKVEARRERREELREQLRGDDEAAESP